MLNEFHDIQAEQAFLCTVIMNNESLYEYIESVTSGDFHSPKHSIIYAGLCDEYNKYKQVDIITLCNRLDKDNTLDSVGGRGYISEILTIDSTPSQIKYYAKIIKENSYKRRLYNSTETLIKTINNSDELNSIIQDIEATNQGITKEYYKDFLFNDNIDDDNSVLSIIESVLEAKQHKKEGELLGYTSDFPYLDKITEGWQKGHTSMILADTSHGKSIALINFAISAAANNAKVLFFSLEMSKEQIMTRMLACAGDVKIDNFKYKGFDDFEKCNQAIEAMTNLDIKIFDRTKKIEDILKAIKYYVDKDGFDFVCIDYIQRIDKGDMKEYEAMTMFSDKLQAIGVEKNIHMMIASQIPNEEKKAKNKSKNLIAKGSGGIIEVADIGIIINREYDGEGIKTNFFGLDVRKNRHNRTGNVTDLIVYEDRCKIKTEVKNYK